MGKINLEALTRDINTYKGNAGVRAATTRDITLEHDAVQKELDRIDRRKIASNELEVQKQQIQNDYNIKNRQLLISEGMQKLNEESVRLNNTLIDKLTEHQVKKAELENDFLEERKNLIPKEFELKEILANHGMAQDMANRLLAIEFKNKDHAFARQMLSAEHFNKLDLMDEEQWLYLDRLAEEYGYKDIQSKEEFARDIYKLQMGYWNEKDILEKKYQYEETLAVKKLQTEHDLEKAVIEGQGGAFFSSDKFLESQGEYLESINEQANKRGWALEGQFGSSEYIQSYNDHMKGYLAGKNWSRNVITTSPNTTLRDISQDKLQNLSRDDIEDLYDSSFGYLTSGDITTAEKWFGNIMAEGTANTEDAQKLLSMGILQPGENVDLEGQPFSADILVKMRNRWGAFKSGVIDSDKFKNQSELVKLETDLNALKESTWSKLEADPEYVHHVGIISTAATAIENALIDNELTMSGDNNIAPKLNDSIVKFMQEHELSATQDIVQGARNSALANFFIPRAIKDDNLIAQLRSEIDYLSSPDLKPKNEEEQKNITALLLMQEHVLNAFNSQVAKNTMESQYQSIMKGQHDVDYALAARERQEYTERFEKLGALELQGQLIQNAIPLIKNGFTLDEIGEKTIDIVLKAQDAGHVGKFVDPNFVFKQIAKQYNIYNANIDVLGGE